MQRDDSVDAPADSVRWAKNLFAVRAAEPGTLRRWVAALISELAPGTPAFGERSAAAGKARQLLFQADEAAIEVHVEPKGKTFAVSGQFLGEFQTGSVATLAAGVLKLECELSEVGGFSFEKVAKGDYELVIRTDEGEFAIERLSIG